VIIWPETAIPAFHSQIPDYLLALQERALNSGSDIMLGLAYKKPGDTAYYNSIVNFGARPGVYKKRHLVPFGEYLPFDSLIRPLLHALKIPMSQFSSGDEESSVLQVAGLPFGFSICYEDAFGEEVIQALPTATVLVNVSNDAWFGDSIAPHQHLQMARMRALETERYMLRATNTGISAVIDYKGHIVAQSPQFEPHTLSALAYPRLGITPYAMTGNWSLVCFCLGLILLGISTRRRT
jgi:apolipoprotein N-acyltransferase